jgi:hypothetical protein
MKDVMDLSDEAIAEWAVATTDQEPAGAEVAKGVAAGDEGCAPTANHVHATNMHISSSLPLLTSSSSPLPFLCVPPPMKVIKTTTKLNQEMKLNNI